MDKWRYVENDSCSSFHVLDPTQVPAQTDRVGPDGLLAPVQDTMWYLRSKLGTSIIHQKHLRAKNSENIQKLSSHSRVLLRLFECCFWYTYIYIYMFIYFLHLYIYEVESLENWWIIPPPWQRLRHHPKVGKFCDSMVLDFKINEKEQFWKFWAVLDENKKRVAIHEDFLQSMPIIHNNWQLWCIPIFDWTRRESRRKWGQLAIANGNCTLQCQATRACSR